ncbi:MAG: tetratricopeptide repeat protein, partial [Pseudomonadota bacterium]
AGFERAIGEPLTVQLDMTRRARFQRLVRATLRDGGDAGEFSLNWALHDAEDGSVLISGQRPFDKARVFEAVDDVTAEILTYVNEQLDSPLKLTDVPVAETVTPNVDALEQYVTSRMIKELDQNETDYVESLQRAVEIDSQFAEAHAGLGFYHYFRGDTEAAIAALDTALQYDYRLSTESRFNVQINRQATASNQAEALRIAETWTRVEPENEFAFYRLAALQKARSDMLDEAAASYKRVLEINPQAEEAYLSLADLEIQRQNWDAASEYAQAFSELNPEDYAGQIKLAQILAASGRYDEAIATYEQAGYLQSNTIGPPLGIVSVLARRGDFSNALDRIASLQQRRLTDNERLQLLTSQVQVLTLAGRFSDAIARMEEEREVAQRVMQPLLYQLQYRGQLIMMGASAGESIDSVVGQLAALREEMQPPFSSAIHWYEASLFAVLGKKPEYIDAFARSKAFFDMQAGNDVIKPVRLGAEARLHVYEGDNALGLEALRESLRLSEASILNMVSASESYLLRASLYDLMREAGEPRDAVEGLQTIVDAFPGLAVGHLYLAKAYVDLGQWRRAETAIRRAEDLWANADAGLHYLEEIADLRAALDAV